MAVITLATPKGGAGKTTISLLLAIELCNRGYSVALLEVDHAKHVFAYAGNAADNETPVQFEYQFDDNPDTLATTIKNLADAKDIVIVDLPGAGDKRLARSRAMARSNLVIVPLNCIGMDANMAGDAIAEIQVEEEHLEREIPHMLVLNRVAPKVVGVSKTEKYVADLLTHAGLPVASSRICQRECYGNFTTFSLTLEQIKADAKPGRTKSVENALEEVSALTEEVLAKLQTGAGR